MDENINLAPMGVISIKPLLGKHQYTLYYEGWYDWLKFIDGIILAILMPIMITRFYKLNK